AVRWREAKTGFRALTVGALFASLWENEQVSARSIVGNASGCNLGVRHAADRNHTLRLEWAARSGRKTDD
ncbi:MAG: hypothetical protein WA894_13360, partial [Candidatus Acidiferrum sp.]